MSVLSSIRGIERAHVVVLLCDAEEGVAEQDAKILGLAEERGRAMVVALNKSDLLDKSAASSKAEELAREKLRFAPFVPVVRISAKTGRGVGELFATIDKVRDAFYQPHRHRRAQPLLRAGARDASRRRRWGGRAPRLYYVTQAETAPPTFIVMTNAPDSIHFSYRRFVVNQLRKHFGFEGVPVRVHYKAPRGGEGERGESVRGHDRRRSSTRGSAISGARLARGRGRRSELGDADDGHPAARPGVELPDVERVEAGELARRRRGRGRARSGASSSSVQPVAGHGRRRVLAASGARRRPAAACGSGSRRRRRAACSRSSSRSVK